MSFGASPVDITAVVARCKSLYRECRAAGGEYNEISQEVRGLYTILRHLKREAGAADSQLNYDSSIWTRQLAPTIADCDSTLRQLDALLTKYASNGAAGGSRRLKLGSDEMDQMGAIRVKLIRQEKSLKAGMDSITLPPSQMGTNLDNSRGQLDTIFDKVDAIADRMSQRRDDHKGEAWKQFMAELIAEGFSREVLEKNQEVLQAYIGEVDKEGRLKNPLSGIIPPAGRPPATRQIEAVTAAQPDLDAPPFPLPQMQREDSGTKEMLAREDNMKFPASMKFERRKPESRTEPPPRMEMAQVPKPPQVETKDPYFINTDGTSEEDDDSDSSKERPKSPTDGEVINTTELISLSQAVMLRPQPGAVTLGSLPYRARGNEYAPSPSHPGAMPIPSSNAQHNGRLGTSPLPPGAPYLDRLSTSPLPGAPYSTSPRPDATYLAPDQNGNEIRPDALWTKIDRRLVSLEVLSQDGRRYEARPEFVAVLGVLPRAEIQSLAARSAALRQARRAQHQHQHQQHQQHPPHPHPNLTRQPSHPPHPHNGYNHHPRSPQPPRPSNFPRSMPTPRHSTSDSDHDREGHTSSESEYPHQPRHKEARPPRSILKNSHSNSYTHSQTPHSPTSPSGWTSEGGRRPPRDGHSNSDEYDRERDRSHRDRDRDRERAREREKEREHARRKERREREREKEKERERDNDKDKDKDKDKKKGFKIGHRDVTAAGIGGAAMSLFTVLSEAAQGI